MTDKEVGELWRKYMNFERLSGTEIEGLIRKLVEERADFYRSGRDPNVPLPSYEFEIGQALRDFGIDPATW